MRAMVATERSSIDLKEWITLSLWLCAFLVFLFPAPSYAKLRVHFAGFALAGNASEAAQAFPITSRLLKQVDPDGTPVLEAALRKAMLKVQNSAIEIDAGLADSHQSGDAVSMAFVLDWENISKEHVSGKTKLVADLHGQILIFDFEQKRVISSRPVAVQLIHAINGPANVAAEETLISDLYFSAGGESLLDRLVERLSRMEVKRSHGNYIRVVSVTLEDKAKAVLAEAGENEAVFAAKVADSFGKRLSENQGVSYIPYSKGASIGGKMSARFANGEVYQFELPASDYRVHLTVRGFKKVLLDSNPAQAAWAYGSYMRVAIKDFDDSRDYLNAAFKFGATKFVPAGAGSYQDWPAFQESIFSLIDQLTRQFEKPDRDWLAKWADGDNVGAQLKDVARIIARSR